MDEIKQKVAEGSVSDSPRIQGRLLQQRRIMTWYDPQLCFFFFSSLHEDLAGKETKEFKQDKVKQVSEKH